jgi:COMPASS component SPP1
VDSENPRITHRLTQDEYEILFEGAANKAEDLGAVHNDMVLSNILVENDRIVGIVGWADAGYFGWERAKKLHAALHRTQTSDSDVAWHDLYDIPLDSNSNINIKTEVSNPPLEAVPPATTTDPVMWEGDLPTPKKITELKRESMSRGPSSERSSPSPSTKGAKKRTAPASMTKKGSTTRKSAPKKRKLNDVTSAEGSTASARGSLTPAGSRPGKASSQKQGIQSSLSVAGSPAPEAKDAEEAAEESEDDDIDPNELFCICRKPDNHTWMIACDGGCEDWFHGKCVDMKQADADLIDKYICKSTIAFSSARVDVLC